MKVEELLALLRDAGLDDKGIKDLLTETIATLPADETPEDNEKAEVGKLLGVNL